MVATSHVHDTFVRAAPRLVWSALTEPDQQVRWTAGYRVESSFRPGDTWRLVATDGDRNVVEGAVETFEAPRRLTVGWRFVGESSPGDEPPSRVDVVVRAADDAGTVTRIVLQHTGLALSPLTWDWARTGWPLALDSLKTFLETGEPLPSVTPEQDALDADEIEGNWHRAQAIVANNSVWELLDGRTLRPEEEDELLERAYAAAHHWRRATGATVVNRARATYLLSRAHASCGHGELALHHADRCSELVAGAPDDMADFDHAYAYEARARALACLGRQREAREMRRRAAAVPIADEQDRSIFGSDLAAGPWFGLDQPDASRSDQ
jgi:uncharacterized protein YndB with AHSA1/START domain